MTEADAAYQQGYDRGLLRGEEARAELQTELTIIRDWHRTKHIEVVRAELDKTRAEVERLKLRIALAEDIMLHDDGAEGETMRKLHRARRIEEAAKALTATDARHCGRLGVRKAVLALRETLGDES